MQAGRPTSHPFPGPPQRDASSSIPTLRRLIARADRFLLLLIATVALAAIVPTLAVALLFLLYGARSAPQAIWAGLAHRRLQRRVFACALLAQRDARRP